MTASGFLRSDAYEAPGGDGREAPVVLDDAQRAVLELADDASAVVLGAPGTGKTTTLAEFVADRVERAGFAPEQLLVLTSSRGTATRLRDRLALRLGLPTNGPLARTVNSLAFDIVGHAARIAGTESPQLVTGGEQDSDLSQLLAGQLEDGTGPEWPEHLSPEVRRLRGFRTELRELMARATEFGVTPPQLRALGIEHGRPEWVASADFIAEYLAVISSSRPHQLDSAELVQFAVTALAGNDPGATVGRLRLVVVDDLQEAPRSTMLLLRALAARGIAIVGFGDPDVAANAFRGGEPDALGRLGSVLGVPALVPLTLHHNYRSGTVLTEFTGRITERIGTAGVVGHRAVVAAGAEPDEGAAIRSIQAATPAREWLAIAHQLREWHLVRGLDWSDMVVVARSGAQVPVIARALALAEVPTRTAVGGSALRDDHAARGLLTVIDVAIGRAPLTPEIASELLLGPFGGLDRLALRRVRLALRAEEIAGGGNRASDELLVEALSAPGRFATIDARVGRNAERMSATLAAVAAAFEAGGTIEELLWLAWERSGLAGSWRDQALSAGITAAEANRNLDGVVALFTAAKRFVERQPGTAATVFLDQVLDAEVPEDTLSPQSQADTVLVATPAGTIGLEFDVVVVAALQEGVWPNLRLRGSLLYPQQLVRVMGGLGGVEIDERRQVRDDELRMFALAVSRARRQVILAAVANEDEMASVLFALAPEAEPVNVAKLHPLSLRELTGRLRRELTQSKASAEDRRAAASALATLAQEKVPGADPAQWHGLLEPSTTEPLFLEDERVRVSPSKLEAFEQSALDWFIDSVSGTQSSTAMGLGTIVHWAMETATDPAVDAIWNSIESRWRELVFESSWLEEQQKRAARILAGGVAEYLADFVRDDKQLIAAERRFELELGRATVNGSIDRIERNVDGAVVIVDLKTGTPITTQKTIDDNAQLGVYQLAYAEGLLDELLDGLGEHHGGGAKLLYVKKGLRSKLYREGIQAPLDEDQLEGFRERIRQAAIGMAQAAFDGEIDLDRWSSFDVASRRLHRVRAVSSD
ncbi:ATP-dependent helicase [Parafrigoribacterium humi]|uniref:ATP-dependent helicase n=1 Tax=Parafrigoribacterium humi TaxID=3144664 RepID=UPI0032F02E44